MEKRRERIAEAQKGKEGSLPYFVVIGAQKGGTGFFYRMLCEHPSVERAAAKELHYFDDNFPQGVGWYRRCFPEGFTGEATPSYLFAPDVPQRMERTIPDAKLIALLRNPVDRAYSHYQMSVRRGEERSFEDAVKEEDYLARGHYAEQLERFSFFSEKGNLLVIKSEDLFSKRPSVLVGVLDFLGLPPFEATISKPANKVTYPPMGSDVRKRLEEHFEPYNQRLYEMLGRDMGW